MWLLLLWATQAQVEELPGAKLYLEGRYPEARQSLEAAPEGPSKRFWMGYTLLALGRKPDAVAEFEKYLAKKPKDEDVLYAVARTYAQLADLSFQQVFALDPQSARAYQLRGIRDELEGRWKDAMVHYRKALAIEPKLAGVHASMARIYEQELKDPERARVERKQGLRSGQETVDLEKLLRRREAESRNPDVYFRLGETYAALKEDAARRLRAVNPRSYRVHQLRAESLAAIHKKPEAIAELRKVLAEQPNLPGVHYELARLLADSQPEEAVKLLRIAIEADPSDYQARSLLGQILVVTGDYSEAIPNLESALAGNDTLMRAHRALGQALVETKDAERGLRHLLIAAESEPDDEQVHFLLAKAYRALGREQEAAREMELHREVLRRLANP